MLGNPLVRFAEGGGHCAPASFPPSLPPLREIFLLSKDFFTPSSGRIAHA